MKLLTLAFVWLLTKTCTGHQGGKGGSLGQKLHFLGQFSPWKLEICWVNISESRLTLKIWLHDSRISPFLSIKMLSIFLYPPPPPPWRPLFIVIYKEGNVFWQALKTDIFEHISFSLAPRSISKLKQDVNISPLVNHSMLKTRGHSIPIKWKCLPETN